MLTLASDFGTPYPAAMKGVIASRSDARLVDVAHGLPRQDVRAAAFWLRFVLPEFPPAVHLVVVDPGVGTDRDALVVRAGDHALVGPDNGSLLPPARALAGDGPVEAFAVAVDDPRSSTFHGRDVFAPVAAAVHETGVASCHRMDRLTHVDDPVDITVPEPTIRSGSVDGDGDLVVDGEVLVVDDFGNAITNLPGEFLAGRERAEVDGVDAPVVETFAEVDPGDRLVTVGSHGRVECDVNRGRGDEAFDLAAGDAVRIRLRG